jgi:hypothetical protein
MTESLPVKLSPLAPELTKFFQKDKEASAAESPAKPKKRRIIQVTDDSSDTATGIGVKNCYCRDR